MSHSNARRLAMCATVVLASFAPSATGAEILIGDAKSQPESLTVAPGGVLIVGSASTPFVYKVRPPSSTVEKFIDASDQGPGTFFFGMLAWHLSLRQTTVNFGVLFTLALIVIPVMARVFDRPGLARPATVTQRRCRRLTSSI